MPALNVCFPKDVAEAAIEELDSGVDVEKVAPFWRVLSSEDRLAKKLDFPLEMIDSLRRSEVLEDRSTGVLRTRLNPPILGTEVLT